MSEKWYWAIRPEGDPGICYVGNSGSLYGKDTSFLWSGQRVADWPDVHTIKSSSAKTDGPPLDVLISYLDAPVFSRALQMALRGAGINEIQFLPIRVLKSDGIGLAGFAIANILSVVNALDTKRSQFQRFSADPPFQNRAGDIRSLECPVLLQHELTGHHVIRLRKYLFPIFVSDYFRRTFEDGGFSGYQFIEVAVSSEAVH